MKKISLFGRLILTTVYTKMPWHFPSFFPIFAYRIIKMPTLPRSFFHSEEWLHPRVFSKAEAWLDILASVRFTSQPTTITIAEKTIAWQKDCWPVSQREGITIIQVTDKEQGRNTFDASETSSVTPHATPCATPCVTPCVTPHATPRETPHAASPAISPPFGATVFATPSVSPCATTSVPPSVSASVTKQNKEKEERININDPTTPARVRDEVFDLSLNRLWCEAVCMRYPTWRSSTRSSLLSTISCRSSRRAREIKSPYSKEQETKWFPAPC